MNYILNNHIWSDDIVSTIMMFFPNEKYIQVLSPEKMTLVSELEGNKARAVFYRDGDIIGSHELGINPYDEKSTRYGLRISAFKCLMSVKKVKMPWGALTGVRPAKIVWNLWDQGCSDEEVYRHLTENCLVSEEKARLCITVARNEREIIKRGSRDKIGLYIGIPFCPTRCLYCSFTSYPLKQYADRVDKYLDALEREIEFVSGITKDKTIESLYIGGGTPTSLNEAQLDRLL